MEGQAVSKRIWLAESQEFRSFATTATELKLLLCFSRAISVFSVISCSMIARQIYGLTR
jgi:hypothetical protein